MKSQATTGIAN